MANLSPRSRRGTCVDDRTCREHARLLAAITRVELAKRYAGSVLGMAWVVLQPALLLSVYLFVYLVVFKMRFQGFSRFDYVLYVFCGLVPFLGFMEAITTGALSIKQNMHLVKNVMLPIELVPVRARAGRHGEPGRRPGARARCCRRCNGVAHLARALAADRRRCRCCCCSA